MVNYHPSMMGHHSKQTLIWAEPVNLAKRIPQDHPLRKINSILKLDFVRNEVAKYYGKNGNESVDPVIIMKLMLLLFLDNVESERELMRIVPLRIDYLWFLGYGLDDSIPNHSVLSKARKRWGTEVFESLFVRTIQQCVEEGLVDGKKLHMDSSLVDANASNKSVKKLDTKEIEQLRQACSRQIATKLEEPQDPDQEKPEKAKSTTSNDEDDDSKPSIKADKTSSSNETQSKQQHISMTDLEAGVVRSNSGGARARYKVHRAIDNQCGVITAVETTCGTVDEAKEMNNLIEEHQAHTNTQPKAVIADSKYGIIENFVALAAQGIRSHMADLQLKQNNHRTEGIFGADKFNYIPEKDVFICPAGKELHSRKFTLSRGHFEYITKPGVCAKCDLRKQCTRSKTGRTLKRHEHQELLDKARKESHGRTAKKDRARRKYLMEGSFADARNHHGFKRSRWRGLWKNKIQNLLIAAIQNLRIIISQMMKETGIMIKNRQESLEQVLFTILIIHMCWWLAEDLN